MLDVLESERAAIPSPYWFGTRIGHADIAVACVLRFTAEAHPHLLAAARYPALVAHGARCAAPKSAVVPRESGVSSTPQRCDLFTGALEYWIIRFRG